MTTFDHLTAELGLIASPEVAPWFVAGLLIGSLLTAFTAITVQQVRHNPKHGGSYAPQLTER